MAKEKGRILVVDDNEMNRDMLTRRLKKRGFQVIEAIDGEEGLETACKEMPDLILMDMRLPAMDGWTAVQKLKQSPETRSIPIIGLSAYAMAGDREKALKVGCDAYDTKPVELSRLLNIMNKYLDQRK